MQGCNCGYSGELVPAPEFVATDREGHPTELSPSMSSLTTSVWQVMGSGDGEGVIACLLNMALSCRLVDPTQAIAITTST